jgi:hypothetical protein
MQRHFNIIFNHVAKKYLMLQFLVSKHLVKLAYKLPFNFYLLVTKIWLTNANMMVEKRNSPSEICNNQPKKVRYVLGWKVPKVISLVISVLYLC